MSTTLLSDTGVYEVRVRSADGLLRIVRCTRGATRCSEFNIDADGRVARHRNVSFLDGVVPSSP